MENRKIFLLGTLVCGILLTACAEKTVTNDDSQTSDAVPLVEETTLPVSGTEDTVDEPSGPTELPDDLVPNDQ